MAQLILTAATTVGGAVAKSGLGAFLVKTAATTAGAYAAGYASRLIFGPRKRRIEGPRLDSFTVQASQEGAAIPRVYGRARLAGQLIWAANFKEETAETVETAGGKGAAPASRTTTVEYLYSISVAIGLCEGPITRLGRVWADGKPFDLSKHNARIYLGEHDQPPDALIEAVEGAGHAPAFRGLAYIVFEDLPLKDFGNRIPQFSFEIDRSLRDEDPGALENTLTAVTIIPGTGEFVYGTTAVTREAGEGVTLAENVNNNSGSTDFVAALDGLVETAPNLKEISIIVSWFGDRLEAGGCKLRPGVDAIAKTTSPYEWRVAGAARSTAHLISQIDDAAVYGGTPADRAVIEAITALKAKGIKVMIHPFILMDMPGFPWRGRIGVGANDQTAAADNDIAAFFGSASASDFTIVNGDVLYSGPTEWSFRRMILHYAALSKAAGGVDRFLLGSELVRLTTARNADGGYPAVLALRALADEVRALLGPETAISYGADWSEYFGHQPTDGSGDVYFHLDDLWSAPAIDFIGIDNYMPMADWRDGFAHLDASAGYKGPHDVDYLMANINGGEGYDWYYASSADRDSQTRTLISDNAYNEPWVFRYKDLWNWWSQAHYNRPGGVRDGAPTAWVPESKPIVFTETGCPAIDKGANQPNVFVDPKSDESAAPYYSNARRDDMAQRRFLEAQAAFWSDPANNPQSSIYGEAMVDAARRYVYAVDARPYPDFPARRDVWSDGENWRTGHWLNGRLGRAPLDLLVGALLGEVGFTASDATTLDGLLTGYIVDRPVSPREAIDPLADIYQFDVIERDGVVHFQPRRETAPILIAEADLVADKAGAFSLNLDQGIEAPGAFRLGFFDEEKDYNAAVAEARSPGGASLREAGVDAPIVIPAGEASARARAILADGWVVRERLSFSLPPSGLAIEPGDLISLDGLGDQRRFRVIDIEDAGARRVELVRVAPAILDAAAGASDFAQPQKPAIFGAPVWALADLPFIDGADPAAPYFAAFADPWPGAVALYRDAGAPVLSATATAPAIMGRLASPLLSGGSGRWSGTSFDVSLSFGALASRSDDEILAGANLCAVESANGSYELCQFRNAQLLENGDWRLSGLLRGQAGGEAEALAGAEAGARFFLVSRSVEQASLPLDLRDLNIEWQAGPAQNIPDTDTYSSQALQVSARGLKPLSPVHLRANHDGGDIHLRWLRRTREGGDSWEGEPPLAEREERYQVTIYDGASALRVVETTTPDYRYLAADIVADFGADGPGSSLTYGVAQLSDAVGPGIEARMPVILGG